MRLRGPGHEGPKNCRVHRLWHNILWHRLGRNQQGKPLCDLGSLFPQLTDLHNSPMFSTSSPAGPLLAPSRAVPRSRPSCAESHLGGNGVSRSQRAPRGFASSSCECRRRGTAKDEPCQSDIVMCRKLDDPGRQNKDGETPEELTKVYLSCLYQHFIGVLEKRLSPGVVKATPMDFVVTVPAIWSNAAKEATERAAARAGFCGNQRIQLITEPVWLHHLIQH